MPNTKGSGGWWKALSGFLLVNTILANTTGNKENKMPVATSEQIRVAIKTNGTMTMRTPETKMKNISSTSITIRHRSSQHFEICGAVLRRT